MYFIHICFVREIKKEFLMLHRFAIISFSCFIFQLIAAISVSIGSMVIGFNAAYTATALTSMSRENSTLNLTESEKSWIGSLLPLSALGGSIIGGSVVDLFGRKAAIMLCGPPFFSGKDLYSFFVFINIIPHFITSLFSITPVGRRHVKRIGSPHDPCRA